MESLGGHVGKIRAMEIRIYIEGGGNQNHGKTRLRQGFSQFLNELSQAARGKRIRFRVVCCGGRGRAYDMFLNSPIGRDCYRFLLVDAEGPVNTSVKQHLTDRDGWDLSSCDESQCHLMVELMESWFLADRDALKAYYGDGFRENRLPGNAQVEKIPKNSVETSLDGATEDTQKGTYHKARHGPELLEKISPEKVKDAAPHCQRFFDEVRGKI